MKLHLNVVIPMAGLGSRFAQEGFLLPKPFIDVDGLPMIVRVLENLNYPDAHYILIARSEHLERYPAIVTSIEARFPNIRFVAVDQFTEGTACTILYARQLINNENPLLIANSDQLVDLNIADFIADADRRDLDGSILCFKDAELNPKWSFAQVGEDELVIQVKEKVVISDLATVGIYYFRQGSDFVNSAIDMIIQNDRVNNEFYTCPSYNYAINAGKRVGVYLIDTMQMHGIGTPADLKEYLRIKRFDASKS
jgi:UDP-N-acetylglucosamine diphosphorylase / glucose-1-phosphate thymidylyltransferase / UDP-N-acetylgalactosamine diphosphorylase / glucosamine-1-phosphate N-acetyltransferase / galactosamine-1-phosphate N-acetyltransferase